MTRETNISMSVRGVRELMTSPKPKISVLIARARTLRYVAQDLDRFSPWPALRESLIADAEALEAMAEKMKEKRK